MTPDARFQLATEMWDRLIQIPVGNPDELRKTLTEHVGELNHAELIDLLGGMLSDSLDIGAILAEAIGRHPDAAADAVKLREQLEFARIASRILNGDQ